MAGKEPDKSFWEKDGNALVGRRILVSWAREKRYEATVTHFDHKDGQHYVAYDDGEKKWYDLRAKTFWVVGDPEKIKYEPRPGGKQTTTTHSIPTVTNFGGGGSSYGGALYGGYTGNYQHVWTPYVSTVPNARTAASFHCFLDPRVLGEGERVVLCGNLEEMGGSVDGLGVAMTPHPRSDGTLWELTLELPFSLVDSCLFGMFQFSYKVVHSETGLVAVSEGAPVRKENSMQPHFYHVFRNNFTEARFRGWSAPYGKAVVQPLARLLLEDLRHGIASGGAAGSGGGGGSGGGDGGGDAGTVRGVLARFKCLCVDVSTAARGHIEDLFDEEVESGGDAGIPPPVLLALVSMVGQFGATTKEKVYTAANTQTAHTYSVSSTTTLTYRKPPEPRPWCRYLLSRCSDLVVGQWYHLALLAELGPHSSWLVAGVGECAERLSYHNSFQWLRLMPLLAKHHVTPEIYDNTHHASSERDFMDEAAKCVSMAEEQLHLATAQRAQHEEDHRAAAAAAAAAPPASAGEHLMGLAALGVTLEHFAPPAADLARAWLSALLAHSPTLDQLASLVLNSLQLHLVRDRLLVAPFASKVGHLTWTEASSFDALEAMLEAAPLTLKHPTVAAALLNNKTPPKALNARVLTFVVHCLRQEETSSDTAGNSGAAASSSALTSLSVDGGGIVSGDGQGANELVGDWMELNTAAKAWVRRAHESEPPRLKADAKAAARGGVAGDDSDDDDDDDDDAGGWGTGWLTRGGNKKNGGKATAAGTRAPHVPLTVTQVATLRASCLEACFADVDRLLECPFFARNPKGVLFDVGRCWFFRGSPMLVLEAICALSARRPSSGGGVGGGGRGLGSFKSPLLETHLSTEALKLVKNTSHSVAEVTRLLQVVSSSLPPAMPLAHHLLSTLATDTTWGTAAANRQQQQQVLPPLASVLRNSEMWQQILAWCREGGVLSLATDLTALLALVTTVLTQASEEVKNDTVNLKTLTTLLTGGGSGGVGGRGGSGSGNVNRVLHLLRDFSPPDVEVEEVRGKLVECEEVKRVFDDRLQRCQAYASFFCVSAGVKIDAAELRKTVDKLTSGYDRLTVSEIKEEKKEGNSAAATSSETDLFPPPPPKFTFTGFASSSDGGGGGVSIFGTPSPPSTLPPAPPPAPLHSFSGSLSAPFVFGSGTAAEPTSPLFGRSPLQAGGSGGAAAAAVRFGFTSRLGVVASTKTSCSTLASIPKEVDWLFDLRSSELFLGLWRATAAEVLREEVYAASTLSQHAAAASGGGGGVVLADGDDDEEEEEEEAEQMPPLPEDIQGDEGAIQEFIADQQAQMQARAQARAVARQQRAEARFARQDEEKRVHLGLETRVLSQLEVVHRLLPRAQTAWQKLAANASEGTLSVAELDRTFGKLPEAQMKDELRLLVAFGVGREEEEEAAGGSKGGGGRNGRQRQAKRVEGELFGKLADYRLLRKLGRWLPAILKVHGHLQCLCSCPQEEDAFRQTLSQALERIESSVQTSSLDLSAIPGLVAEVRGVCAQYSEAQLDFVATLGESSTLLAWLLEHSDQQEFNEMLNVIRPCTDDPRLLSAIASLVYIRTLLLEPLYSRPPYQDLEALLTSFTAINLGSGGASSSSSDGSPLWHLQNIVESFELLADVFEKQTKSPSIKSLHDLRDLVSGGTFVLRVGVPPDQVLTVRITETTTSQSGAQSGAATSDLAALDTSQGETTTTKVLNMESLLDLRSKLLMAEIPDELEAEFGASLLIEAFVQQLQVMSDTADALQLLFASGHASVQETSYRHARKVGKSVGSLASAQAELKGLQGLAEEWARQVTASRDRFYFLNFFTMREILKIRDLVVQGGKSSDDDDDDDDDGEGSEASAAAAAMDVVAEGNGEAPGDAAAAQAAAEAREEEAAAAAAAEAASSAVSAELELVTAMGFPLEHAEVALRRCDNNVDQAIEFLFSHSMHMDRLVSEEDQQRSAQSRGSGASSLAAGGGGIGGGSGDAGAFVLSPPSDPVEEFTSVLHAVSSKLDESLVPAAMLELKQRLVGAGDGGEENDLLTAFGLVLESLFGATPAEAAAKVGRRALPEPGATAANRADMLIAVDHADGSKSHPIFCAHTDSPAEVMEVVLSVYVRRGRLPEPGEVLFATAQTSMEEVELLVRRFLRASAHGRSDHVFCLADLHVLSYTQQCHLVDRVRALLLGAEGATHASTLLLVSGKPQQVALNQLSQHAVDLLPLQRTELQRVCKVAFERHVGPTECVSSVINGGGKSHHIMKAVAEQQRGEECEVRYARVPIRESTTPASLVQLLGDAKGRIRHASGGAASLALHLDIAHILPASANTMLFELLLVGLLRDVGSCRTFHRSSSDRVLVELPNSPGNKSALALHLVSLLPTTVLECAAKTMELVTPAFADPPLCSRIVLPDYSEAKFVARWIRGFKAGKLNPSDPAYDPSFNAYSADVADMTSEEVFAELLNCCCPADGPSPNPSFAAFRQFAVFMNEQFTFVDAYPLLDGGTLAMLGGGWPLFKHAFVRLMVETSRDFSLRSVAQVNGVGPLPPAKDDEQDFAGAAAAETAGAAAEGAEGGGGRRGKRRVGYEKGSVVQVYADDDDDDDEYPPPPAAPQLLRRASSSREEEAQRVAAAAPAPLRRETTLEMAARFGGMRSWESSDHPIVLFKVEPRDCSVSGVDLMTTRDSSFVDRYIDRQLRAELEASGIDFKKDWTKIGNEEAARRLREVEGLFDRSEGGRGGVEAMDAGYTLTVDNLLKMISIQLRLKFNLPVVIMGETGCGKSSLIRNLCAVIGSVLRTLNIHGGMDDQTIVSWMQREVDRARRMRGQRVVVFFDEVNTCNCMGLFKEIVCDRTLNGVPIPDNIKIVAACNPYRLRDPSRQGLYGGEEMAGLVYDHHGATTHSENVGTGIKDPLRNLVYRVHPLPESLIDYIFDFGALSSETEKIYIKSMLKKSLAPYNPDEDGDGDGNDGATATTVAAPTAGGGGGAYAAWTNSWAHVNKKKTPFEEFIDVYTELVCSAQECIRRLHGGERSSASLRDVRRCVDVFQWFGRHFFDNKPASERWTLEDFFSLRPSARPTVRKAVILSVAFCYHARLPRQEREVLVDAVTASWRKLQVQPTSYYPATPAQQQAQRRAGAGGGAGGGLYSGAGWGGYEQPSKCEWLRLDVSSFNAILSETQRGFTKEFNVGPGIAFNEALCENLFMILVSVLNQIPIFVIGKPGSSKSLAMGLVQSNLNGPASDTPFLRSLPAVEVFPYQCSPLSTSTGIELAFASAQRYRREAPGTVVVVLLDEVGLAEQSPHLPLKVLHKTLDEAGENESVVGISNWALDPAKMNRAVHLYRPAPTVEDLSLTAEGMVRSANLKGYLQALARAYSEVYHAQLHPDFWGLREFYSTVRAINGALAVQREEAATSSITAEAAEGGTVSCSGSSSSSGGGGGGGDASSSGDGGGGGGSITGVALDGPMLLNAVLRNFGGRPMEVEKVVATFFRELGLPLPQTNPRQSGTDFGGGVEALVRSNLREPSARHLMLLTKSNAALGLLFDRGTLRHDKTEIIFGSDFPLDQTDLQVCLDIQRVKLCMASGVTAVLVHCESLYESLYDLLNQHYSTYGGQLYVRLAFGTHSRLCPIHPTFRVVCVVEKTDAYEKLAPPLLNRFEKQVLERSGVLLPEDQEILRKLRTFCQRFTSGASSSSPSGVVSKGPGSGAMRVSFCGFHSDLLSSLILTARARLKSRQANKEREQQRKLETGRGSNSGDGGGEGGGDEEEGAAAGAAGGSAATKAVGTPELSSAAEAESSLVRECIKQLLWIAAPERVCRVLSSSSNSNSSSAADDGGKDGKRSNLHSELKEDYGVDVGALYFRDQKHSSLPAFADRMLEEWARENDVGNGGGGGGGDGGDGVGSSCIVTTHSPLTSDVARVLAAESSSSRVGAVSLVVLHELDQERELRSKVGDFFKAATAGAVLLVQCDPLATSIRRIEHAKFLIEQARARYVNSLVVDAKAAAASTAAAEALDTVTALTVDDGDSKAAAADADNVSPAEGTGEEQGAEKGGGKAVSEDGHFEKMRTVEPIEVEEEEEGAKKEEESLARGVHVILLLHLPRGVENKYCLSFDLRWRYAFVDSVDGAATSSGLPDVESMIGKRMLEVVQGLDLRKVLRRCCRPALAKLLYGRKERTNEQVRAQISTLLAALENPAFVSALKGCILDMLAKSEAACSSSQLLDVSSAANEEAALALAGTFQAALHHQVLDAVASSLAIALSHADRADGLALLAANGGTPAALTSLWLDLFQASFQQMSVFELVTASRNSRASSLSSGNNGGGGGGGGGRRRRRVEEVEVPEDGLEEPFSSRLPFSFFLSKHLDALRFVIVESEATNAEAALGKQFSLLGLGHGIDGELSSGDPDGLLKRYMFDFTCLQCSPVRHMTRAEQAEFLWNVLNVAGARGESKTKDTKASEEKDGDDGGSGGGGTMSTLAAIHCRFWRTETSLRLYFSLLDAVPESHASVTALFQPSPSSPPSSSPSLKSSNRNLAVLSTVLAALEPQNQGWAATAADDGWSVSVFEEWSLRVAAAQPFVESLLDLITDDDKENGGMEVDGDGRGGNAGLLERWARLSFHDAFVRKVCVPLDLGFGAALSMVRAISNSSSTTAAHQPLGSSPTLRAILKELAVVNDAVLKETVGRVADEYLCPITAEKISDPVTAADGFTFERSAIAAWFSLGHRDSPLTGLPLSSTHLTPNAALKASIEREVRECDLGGFLESVLLDLVLVRRSNSGHSVASLLKEDFLRDLVAVVAGECPGNTEEVGSSSSPVFVAAHLVPGILPGQPGRVALLRELLRLPGSTPAQSKAVTSELALKLASSVKRHGFLDTPLSVAFTTVLEYESSTSVLTAESESAVSSPLLLAPSNSATSNDEDLFAALKLSASVPDINASNVVSVLRKIAEVRRRLVAFADLLIASSTATATATSTTGSSTLGSSSSSSSSISSMEARVAAASQRVAPLLLGKSVGEGSSSSAVGVVRSMRVFLLKQLEQRQGASFARGALQASPLRQAQWVLDWKKDDAGFLRFLGHNALPRFHPLAVLPTFAKPHLTLTTFLATGDIQVLAASLREIKVSSSSAAFKSGLLAALFHGVFLLSVLPKSGAAFEANAAALHAWLWTRPPAVLDAVTSSTQEFGLFLLFSGALHAALGVADHSGVVESLRLDPKSSPEKIIRVQLLAHLAAAAVGSEEDGKASVSRPQPSSPSSSSSASASSSAAAPATLSPPLSVFRTMMLSPAALKGSWLPTMPEDTLKMAQEALGGRWYRCPNGHPFYVDLCGRPTVIQTCAECGASIGGTDHNLLDGNQDIGDVGKDLYKSTVVADSSEPDYCLRPPEDDATTDQFMTSRGLNPTSLRTIRFLMHGAMVVGAAAAEATARSGSNGGGGSSSTGIISSGDNSTASSSSGGWCEGMSSLMNSAFTGSDKSRQRVEQFLLGHLDSNWSLLKTLTDRNADDLSVLLHLVLLSTGPSRCPDTDHPPAAAAVSVAAAVTSQPGGEGGGGEGGGEGGGGGAAAAAVRGDTSTRGDEAGRPQERDGDGGTNDGGACNGNTTGEAAASSASSAPAAAPVAVLCALTTTAKRNAWEKEFDQGHLSRILNGAPEAVTAAAEQGAARFAAEADGDQGGAFRAEVAERFEAAAHSSKARAASQLELWRYRRPFCLAQFSTALERLSGGNATSNPFPALSHFLAHEEMLRADCLLPKVLEFIRLLLHKFNRKLDRDAARKTTVGEVLSGVLDPFERVSWEVAFDGFSSAWNSNWKFVERFECLEVPKEYGSVGMSRQQALSFCLPCDTDEGICSLALVQHLRTEHNNLVHSVDERLLTGKSSNLHAKTRDSRVVSSRHFTESDTVRYDLQQGLVPYLAKHCVTLEGGFDFGKAEARLLERHLSRVPVIDLELRTFSFSHEQHLSGGLAPLKAKVPQEPLPKDTVEAVAREFGKASPAKAAHVLEQLETVVAFLTATGGGFVGRLNTSVGELLLSQYVKTFLLVDTSGSSGGGGGDSSAVDFGRAVSTHVRLKHIEALWQIMLDLTETDPFAKVSSKYRVLLEKGPAAALASFVGGLGEADRDALRVVLKAFIVENLAETTTADSRPLAEILGFSELGDSYLCDLEWFRGFPTSVSMACAVSAYGAIEALV